MGSYQFNEFCVISAKTEELREVIKIFDAEFQRLPGVNITSRIYQIPSTNLTIRVATCSAMGHVEAAVRTSQILHESQPSFVIFHGTAASLKPSEIQIGNVVIPKKSVNRIYDKISEQGQRDYNSRIQDPSFKETFFTTNALISDLSTIDCAADAMTGVAAEDLTSIVLEGDSAASISLGGVEYQMRQPKIHDDVDIFSCGMVVDSVSYREFIAKNAESNLRKVGIIDMESYGFFKAMAASKGTFPGTACHGVMVRGISDYAGRKFDTEARPQGLKQKCLRNAAIVTAALVKAMV